MTTWKLRLLLFCCHPRACLAREGSRNRDATPLRAGWLVYRPAWRCTPVGLPAPRTARVLVSLSPWGERKEEKGMRDARPCRHAMATRGGDKQEPDAPLPSFPHGVRRRAALLVLEAASQVTVDRGCHSERSLRSEESTRSDLPAASARAGGFATALEDKSLRVDPSLRSEVVSELAFGFRLHSAVGEWGWIGVQVAGVAGPRRGSERGLITQSQPMVIPRMRL